MKAVGITAEYNPLHNGHVYHIGRALELSGCDAAVAAMSGDYVQRGAPAVLDKWTRAEHALRSGIDLVVEIPTIYCLGNAGQYASASVRILESLGCVSHIAFGSECGDTDALVNAARFLSEHRGEIDERIRILSKQGLSYPAARMKACEELGAGRGILDILSSPNDILAIEYIGSMSSAVPVAVKREGAGYNNPEYNEIDSFLSASGIRKMMRDGQLDRISASVPAWTNERLVSLTSEEMDRSEERLFELVRYALLSMDADQIEDCPSGGEGLGNLMKSAAASSRSLDELISKVKSRRYTYTRISRLAMQALLGILRRKYYLPDPGDPDIMVRHPMQPMQPGYVRVLGFNDKGRRLLAEISREERAAIPVITNINKERDKLDDRALACLELDVHAADIYNLITGRDLHSGSDHRSAPVYIPGSL